jgi:hypothetical protein
MPRPAPPPPIEDAAGCWIWQGRIDYKGYGRRGDDLAHRLSYQQHVGPIPAGLQLDHLCRVRACVNPTHLEPVTNAENQRRSPLVNSAKTHCPKGHPYDEENTYRWRKARHCRSCKADAVARYRARKSSKGQPS